MVMLKDGMKPEELQQQEIPIENLKAVCPKGTKIPREK
jgi:hypothetical protein